MNEPIEERDALWTEFLATWPLTRLPSMTLDEYSRAGDKGCFTYWLESRTEGLGSIWGGSAFKFGIYGRKDHTPKPSGEGVIYGRDYAWAEKYGPTEQQAFETVRSLIVKIASAARSGDLQGVEDTDLGTVTKWKIAFLYQDRRHPRILNIYKLKHLRALAKAGKEAGAAQLHDRLAGQRGARHVLEHGDRLWARIEAMEAAMLTLKGAQEALEAAQFKALKPPIEKMAGYQSESGRQLALVLDTKQPLTFYLSAGPWVSLVSAAVSSIVEYSPDKSRNASLAASAPKLAIGNAIVKLRIPTQAVLAQLLEAYDPQEGEPSVPAPLPAPAPAGDKIPLNQIFYGPPGTGKTHRTVDEALRILDPAFQAAHANDRPALKKRYDELAAAQRIHFVTFHQSFAYEDFVEGLRPDSDDAGLGRFEVADGIFKSICLAAETRLTRRAEAPPDLRKRAIWKMSLGNTQNDESVIYQECIEGGYALLGYGKNVDFSGSRSAQDIRSAYRKAGHNPDGMPDFAITSVATFLLKVKLGDLLVVTDGNSKFRAIGEVTGGYEYAPRDDWEGFAQKRRVKWLRVYSPSLPRGELMKKRFMQRTIYALGPESIDLDRLEALLAPEAGTAGAGIDGAAAPQDRKVLVIDEINRGNVSRIFGELITLVEPSKRKGEPEALEVTLPYSKDPFSVPSNIYLIGTMNTADRSLTGLDVALRRRFSFVEIPPRPELLDGVVIEEKIGLGDLLRVLNARIELLLDRDHCIGHACFLHLKSSSPLEDLAEVFRRQVFPLLQEYFFEDWSRIRVVLNDHRKKQEQHRFLRRPAMSMEALIGAEEAGLRDDKRWILNDSAFNFADSYIETIGE